MASEIENDLFLSDNTLNDIENFQDQKNEELNTILEQISTLSTKIESVCSKNENDSRSSTALNDEKRTFKNDNPELIDDFIRNFFVRNNMRKSLEAFEFEWYEMKQKDNIKQIPFIPDQYYYNNKLEIELKEVKSELMETRKRIERASLNWEKLKKECEFHKMHHYRVIQDKNKLGSTLKKLKDYYSKYEPMLEELTSKYKNEIREKTLISIENEKLNNKLKEIEQNDINNNITEKRESKIKNKENGKKLSELMPEGRQNPNLNNTEKIEISTYTLKQTFKGHVLPLSDISIHPEKPIVATVSDDCNWRLWHLPEGQLIMSGEGHKDWISSVDFHPSGNLIVTGSGDNTVKLWSLETQTCKTSLRDNNAIWCVKFHDYGKVLAACGLDQITRIWDFNSERCKLVLRGHKDSVNSLSWLPYTNIICTASADKTIMAWDVRTNLCVATFHGHKNSCNHCEFSKNGNMLGSCDSDGHVIIWDIRKLKERLNIEVGQYPANKCIFDNSGQILCVASDDGMVWNYLTDNGEKINQLIGHDDSVQSVAFNDDCNYLISCGSDCTFRYWAQN